MRFKVVCFASLSILFVSTAGIAEKLSDFGKAWSELSSRYLNEQSFIHYKNWKNQPEDLDKLEQLTEFFNSSRVDLNSKDASTLAFLLNAYNTSALSKILKHYPVDNVQSIPKFFTRKDCRISGNNFSLNEIETMIRQFGDARIHAALVGGSKSAPPLRRDGFSGFDLDSQLNERMQVWLSSPNLNGFDCSDKTITISKIFLWYKRDFGKDDGSIIEVLKQFGPAGEWRNGIESGQCRMDFMEFDGSLNDASMN